MSRRSIVVRATAAAGQCAARYSRQVVMAVMNENALGLGIDRYRWKMS
jgi:hypothetical protein